MAFWQIRSQKQAKMLSHWPPKVAHSSHPTLWAREHCFERWAAERLTTILMLTKDYALIKRQLSSSNHLSSARKCLIMALLAAKFKARGTHIGAFYRQTNRVMAVIKRTSETTPSRTSKSSLKTAPSNKTWTRESFLMLGRGRIGQSMAV